MSRDDKYIIRDRHGTARIMIESEGWFMARRRGCSPFLVYSRNIGQNEDAGFRWWWVSEPYPSQPGGKP